ncbi:hypothetical protein SKAU_G00277990 [Synaphobranchus kaupii]|uniref:Reverse transcriptase domain-containing protein n=1 Tax=Synaphobranchus kaupii TaxID=118154 RepID=A0A9Q1EWH3_SYNKA|nr:hypothetical protein SKAU_G00277990 [Synaphobranchus kaupii]
MEKVHRVEAAVRRGMEGHNEMSGRKRGKEGQVAGNSPEERMNTWFNHFRNLLGTHPTVEGAEEEIPAVLTHLNIDDGPFTAAELARVKSTLKQGKSAGPDCIPPEVLKNCDLDDITLETCNRALMKNNKPDMWSLSNIIPVPKSGDLSKPDNYRGISLTCVIAKMYNHMILNRIRGAIDPYLRENKNGFREGRTTVAQIFALRRIIEEAQEFDILAGVLQGDTLAPFLFIIVLDYALRQAIEGREKDLGFTITPRRSGRFPAIVLTDLDYADDISLISDRVEKAQELLTRVERECAKVGLGLNAKKTEVIAYNTPDHLPLRTTGDTALREVSDFKYLGSWVNSTEQAKLHFFDATIEAVLLYGCECWTLKPSLQKSLDGCYTRMLRAALNIDQNAHVNNMRLYGGRLRLSEKIAARRMRQAGHCHRHRELPASKLVLWEPSPGRGRRSRGRPTPTFVDILKKDVGAETTGEIAGCMEDRVGWRRRWEARLRTTQ